MAASYALLRVAELQVTCSSIGQKLLPTGVDPGLCLVLCLFHEPRGREIGTQEPQEPQANAAALHRVPPP